MSRESLIGSARQGGKLGETSRPFSRILVGRLGREQKPTCVYFFAGFLLAGLLQGASLGSVWGAEVSQGPPEAVIRQSEGSADRKSERPEREEGAPGASAPPVRPPGESLFEVHPHFDAVLALLGSRHVGAEFRAGVLSSSPFRSLLSRALVMGPSVGFLAAGGSFLRLEFIPGFGCQFFVLNALGLGIQLDAVIPVGGSATGGLPPAIRPRAALVGTLRLRRFATEGVWGARWAVHHDFNEGIGVQIGLTLQLDGVP